MSLCYARFILEIDIVGYDFRLSNVFRGGLAAFSVSTLGKSREGAFAFSPLSCGFFLASIRFSPMTVGRSFGEKKHLLNEEADFVGRLRFRSI